MARPAGGDTSAMIAGTTVVLALNTVLAITGMTGAVAMVMAVVTVAIERFVSHPLVLGQRQRVSSCLGFHGRSHFFPSLHHPCRAFQSGAQCGLCGAISGGCRPLVGLQPG